MHVEAEVKPLIKFGKEGYDMFTIVLPILFNLSIVALVLSSVFAFVKMLF